MRGGGPRPGRALFPAPHLGGLLMGAVALAACSSEEAGPPEAKKKTARPDPGPVVRRTGEPDRVTYYQILISFAGAKGGLNGQRTRMEASLLARTIEQRLRAGEPFIKLMHEFSDDRQPGAAAANGPYIACNIGVPNRMHPELGPELPRAHLERAVGDAVFSMGVNEARLVEYDRDSCPWGWHLLWRAK